MRHDYLAKGMVAVLAFASILTNSGFAQRIFGDILGNVTDPSGGGVRDARITVLNLDAGRALTTTTGADGSYLFVELTPGPYKITAEQPGFEQKVISNIRLSADQKVRVDIPLTVGA